MFGPPGVGKGTIANMLVKKYKLCYISASGLLKKELKKKTKSTNLIKEYMSKGELVPGNIIVPLVLKALKNSKKKVVILDGFPRKLDQAESFEKHKNIDLVLDLNAPKKIIIERLSGRRICPKCGAIYHIKNKKPKREGYCDYDNTKLIQREDDKPEVIKERLKIYKEETKPLIKYFKKKGILKKIKASDNPQNILKRVEEVLKTFKSF